MEGKIEMGDMKEKETLTKYDYSTIYEKLAHLAAKCEDMYEVYTLTNEQLISIEQIRDTIDEFEQIMGTNYKGEYADNLECIDIFKNRKENGEPNNISWSGFMRNFRFHFRWIKKLDRKITESL